MGLSTTYTKTETDFLIQQLEEKASDKYNDESNSIANDIIKFIDINTGENVNYRETTKWLDGTNMTDAKVDGYMYRKLGSKYFLRILKEPVRVEYFGAKGDYDPDTDTGTDDRTAINNAILYVKNIHPIKEILFTEGKTYLVNGNNTGGIPIRERGIKVLSDLTYTFEKNSKVRVKTDNTGSYCGMSIYKAERVTFNNPWFQGDRDTHISRTGVKYIERQNNTYYNVGDKVIIQQTGFTVTVAGTTALRATNNIPRYQTQDIGTLLTDGTVTLRVDEVELGEWGHCIEVYESRDVTFNGLRADDAWGDGLYLGCSNDLFDRSQHNNNIKLLGQTEFTNCRRQGLSVISCDNLYAQYIIGTDIMGHDPQAVVDFEPNKSFHTINNCVIENVTAIRCKHAVLFASQANRYGINIGSIVDIDNAYLGQIAFSGLGFTVDNPENYIKIQSYFSNYSMGAPVLLENWFTDIHGKVDISNITIKEWVPSDEGQVTILRLVYQFLGTGGNNTPAVNKGLDFIKIGDVKIMKRVIDPNFKFRPFFMYSSSPVQPNNILSDIVIRYDDINLPDARTEDGVSNWVVDSSSVKVVNNLNATDNYKVKAGTSIAVKNAEIITTTGSTVELRIIRAGFRSAVIINSSSTSSTYTLTFAAKTGISSVIGNGVTVNSNTFTINPGASVQLIKTDTVLNVNIVNPSYPALKIRELIGNPSTNLLDIATLPEYEGHNVFIQYDSSRAGLVNYPPSGRGFILQHIDPSTTNRVFLAIGWLGGAGVLYIGETVNPTTVQWTLIPRIASQSEVNTGTDSTKAVTPLTLETKLKKGVVTEITTPNATDVVTAIALANDNKAKINEIITKLSTIIFK